MKVIGEATVAFLELMEAEGKAFRSAVILLLIGIVLVLVGGAILASGFGFLLWSIYLYFRLIVNSPTAALFTSLSILILGGACVWGARKITQ